MTSAKSANIEKKLCKVTSVIAYTDPISVAARSRGIDQNTLDLLKKKFDPCVRACTIGYFGDALLSHSAQMIYIIDYGDLSKEVMSLIPTYLRPRIKWVDRNRKILKSIEEMMLPLHNELETIWEKKRKETGVKASDIHGHEHGLCILAEFLHTLTAALKYDTEADVDLNLAWNAIKRIRMQVRSSESLALLSRIEGILNCYRISENIPGMMVTNQPTPGDLLKDLLDDAKVISLSKSRYLLGIPGKFEIAMIRIKQKLREIISDRRKRKYLAIASRVGNIATRQINVELPELEIEQQKMFAPPLVSLHELKPNCLRTLRELPKRKPS